MCITISVYGCYICFHCEIFHCDIYHCFAVKLKKSLSAKKNNKKSLEGVFWPAQKSQVLTLKQIWLNDTGALLSTGFSRLHRVALSRYQITEKHPKLETVSTGTNYCNLLLYAHIAVGFLLYSNTNTHTQSLFQIFRMSLLFIFNEYTEILCSLF